MLYSLIYYLLLFICVFSILAIVVFARDKEHTTCRLAKQLLEDKTRVCVYVGANYTQWNEFVPIGASVSVHERYNVSIDLMKNHLLLKT